jgi:NAD(P)H-hydrate epimerase
MKILRVDQIRAADAYTIAHEPIASHELMERAGKRCFEKIMDLFPNEPCFTIYCGTGNNGGDGLVIARLLSNAEKDVFVNIVRFSPNESDDFAINFQRLLELDVTIQDITEVGDLKLQNGVIIDALLGSGVTRKAEGLLAEAISFINSSNKPTVAIDFPSGIFGKDNTPENRAVAVKASITLTFQVPKLPFFLAENCENIGDWYLLDIGLHHDFIANQSTDFEMIDRGIIHGLIHKRSPFDHKGTFGHALLVGGSHGKVGAIVLSAEACLRSGAGLLTVFAPSCGYEILQERIPEAMVLTSEGQNELSGEIPALKYSAIGVGPGIGTSPTTQHFIEALLKGANQPLVIDADALNIIAENSWLDLIPKGSVLTPHPKEFERLFGQTGSSEERVELLRIKAKALQLIILLKGRYTAIATPDGKVFFNTTGNPGMGTAGSGDVLTGIITGLIAQDYTPEHATMLGVHLHGLAGDLATESLSEECVIASDIISHLADAFKRIHQE